MYRLLLLLSGLLGLGGCESPRPLRVAVAANLSLPLQELCATYTAQTGQKVELSSASSGVLTAQIRHGAPFDLFISADMKYPEHLAQEGLTHTPPVELVRGQLVLWSKTPLDTSQLAAYFADPGLRSLGIAQPELAPYGRTAKQWLQAQGWWELVEGRLVYGENIGGVNHYISSQAVDAALTAISARGSTDLVKLGHWTRLPGAPELGIPHGIVMLPAAQPEAQALQAFLLSDAAWPVFERFGYLRPQPVP